MGGGYREIIYLSLHCHHQNDFCIKMGNDESHFIFNVSVGSDEQSQDSVHKPQPFGRERRAEAVSNRGPSAYQPNALPLGQTGSRGFVRLSAPAMHMHRCTLRAPLSGTFLQTLPDLVTPLKGHSLSPRSCPAMRSAPSETFGY